MTFTLVKRPTSPIWYAQFNYNGKHIRKSTKQTDRDKAFMVASHWLDNGFDDKHDTRPITELFNERKIHLLSDDMLYTVLKEYERRGLGKVYKADDPRLIDVYDYINNFYAEDGEYIRNCKRNQKNICINSIKNKRWIINRGLDYWKEHKKPLIRLTTEDFNCFVDYAFQLKSIHNTEISRNYKVSLIKAYKIVFHYAYKHDLLMTDITKFCELSMQKTKRNILTLAQVQALNAIEWNNPYMKLIFQIACVTGMRVGEILALRKRDLDINCIHVSHSYNMYDGLKCTKTGVERIIRFPFNNLMQTLLAIAEPKNMDDFIFCNPDTNKPYTKYAISNSFHKAIKDIGGNPKDYCFHSLRHFYATVMKGKIDDILLQSQTGHQSHAMLEHYADHETIENDRLIDSALRNNFTFIS